MICPLRNISGNALTSDCLCEQCAWWLDEGDCCALTALGRAALQMESAYMTDSRVCMDCGCTEDHACLDMDTGVNCSWVSGADLPEGATGPLCTFCAKCHGGGGSRLGRNSRGE